MNLKQVITTVDDFPSPGVKFLDVSSILADAAAFKHTVKWLVKQAAQNQIESIVAVDARGFIWAGALAAELQIPLFLARKTGKLPGTVVTQDYTTEYSTASLSLLKEANIKGPVMILDDIIATGGTLAAVGKLLEQHWDILPTQQFHTAIVSLEFLPGAKSLTAAGYNVAALECY
jgi:adenine phosphoribosyltransferase